MDALVATLVNVEEALREYVIEAGVAGDAIAPPTPMERRTSPVGCTLVLAPFVTHPAGLARRRGWSGVRDRCADVRGLEVLGHGRRTRI